MRLGLQLKCMFLNAFSFLGITASMVALAFLFANSGWTLPLLCIFMLPFVVGAFIYLINRNNSRLPQKSNGAVEAIVTGVEVFLAVMISLAMIFNFLPGFSQSGHWVIFLGIANILAALILTFFLQQTLSMVTGWLYRSMALLIIALNHSAIWLVQQLGVVSGEAIVLLTIILWPFHLGLFIGFLIRWYEVDGENITCLNTNKIENEY